jgi:hypothetical protein
MTKDSRNVVLGCATDYSPEQVRPFLSTLRGAGYRGEVALVIYDEQSEWLQALAGEYSVTLLSVPRHPQWLPKGLGRRLQNRGRMRLLHRSLQAVLPVFLRCRAILPLMRAHLHPFFHIACGRYFIYGSWLRERRHHIDNVLLTDVRDVFFQGDPFAYLDCAGLRCFMEPAVNLGDEPINTEWMAVTYGRDSCMLYRGRQISCSGTTMGDASSILKYLDTMCVALSAVLARITGLPGVDQAVHNRLIWDGCLPGVRLCENGRDAVMTLKNADPQAFVFDDDGRLLNIDGRPAPVLHQYDFHPGLQSRVMSGITDDAITQS